jgi:hypothetical protein
MPALLMVSKKVLKTIAVAFVAGLAAPGACARQPGLPLSLTDDEFRTMASDLSESAGDFKGSDNLVSNETHFAEMTRLLGPRGGAYIGVGPEQNFSYIAEVRPAMAFVVDIRQENRNLHLLYKALFELSADRGAFVGRLFSRGGLTSGADASVEDLFSALDRASPDAALHEATRLLVRRQLQEQHRFAMSEDDLRAIDAVLAAFHADGPGIHYGRMRPGGAEPSYRDLMTKADIMGHTRSYLSSEERFAFVKDLQARNLVVPVVGDFGGTHALRLISDYIRQRNATVTTLYASNVQVYLSNAQTSTFCETLAGLPFEPDSWFIGSKGMQRFPERIKTC